MGPRFRGDDTVSDRESDCLCLQDGWAAVLCAAAAAAQDYPNRPINIVIPFPPGWNTDLMARALQPELAKALGQPIVIADGQVGWSDRNRQPALIPELIQILQRFHRLHSLSEGRPR